MPLVLKTQVPSAVCVINDQKICGEVVKYGVRKQKSYIETEACASDVY